MLAQGEDILNKNEVPEKQESLLATELSNNSLTSKNNISKNNERAYHKNDSTSLSLKDTIKRTLENNVTIAVEDYNSKVKIENVIKIFGIKNAVNLLV